MSDLQKKPGAMRGNDKQGLKVKKLTNFPNLRYWANYLNGNAISIISR